MPARQFDAYTIGVTTSDAFTNAEVNYELTLPAVKEALTLPPLAPGAPRPLPIVTGFLGRGLQTGAITTLGRGGSDLSCTLLGAALGLAEVQVGVRGGGRSHRRPWVCMHAPQEARGDGAPPPPPPLQVWKDVDGVLTCDPRIVDAARPVSCLTFEEATELAFFGATVLHPLAMVPAMQSCVAVRVKNSYNRLAAGTLITAERDMRDTLVTSIVLKSNVTMVDISSTRMLGTYGFLAQVFGIFAEQKISVDVVATSEVSISLTLDPAKWVAARRRRGGVGARLGARAACPHTRTHAPSLPRPLLVQDPVGARPDRGGA